jgi:hypothetical protein
VRRASGLAHTAPRGGGPARHAHWAEPAPAVPPGICDGRVTNGQQSTDPNGAGDQRPPVPSRPDGGSARRPSDIRAGGDTKPGRGRSTRQSKRGPGRARCTNRYGRWERCLLQARGTPSRGRSGGRRGGYTYLKAIPSSEHPPEDTRWEGRWGHYKHPHQRQA